MRSAVIGCGVIAHQHLPFLSASPLVELVGVCDASPVTARFCRDRYGAEASYTGVDALLTEAAPEVVHILTPPHTHVALIEQCLAAGCHVICEKPMCEDANEAERLLALARHHGRVLIESQNYRFNDQLRALDALIDNGSVGTVRDVEIIFALDLATNPLGDPNLVDARSTLPGGAVHDLAPHAAYLVLHLLRWASVDRVDGHLLNASGNPRVVADQLYATVRVGEARGRIIVASDFQPASFSVSIRGTGGRAEIDFFQPYLRHVRGTDFGKKAPLEQLRSGFSLMRSGFANFRDKVLQHTPYHGLRRMLDETYTALSKGLPPPVTESQIVASHTLVDRLVKLRDPRP